MKNKVKDIESSRPGLDALWDQFSARGASADAVFETLREAILSRVLQPGQNFAEEDFAGAFGVSRTPVREAILRLETEGLVERLSRRGLAISDISPEEVLEIYEVRIVLDALAAELAAKAITPPEVAHLSWINDRMRTAGEAHDFDTMSSLNLEFHELMAKASNNSFLLRQTREVHNRVRRFEGTTFSHPERWSKAITEHEQILAHIEREDADGARRAAAEHMRAARQVRLVMVKEPE